MYYIIQCVSLWTIIQNDHQKKKKEIRKRKQSSKEWYPSGGKIRITRKRNQFPRIHHCQGSCVVTELTDRWRSRKGFVTAALSWFDSTKSRSIHATLYPVPANPSHRIPLPPLILPRINYLPYPNFRFEIADPRTMDEQLKGALLCAWQLARIETIERRKARERSKAK